MRLRAWFKLRKDLKGKAEGCASALVVVATSVASLNRPFPAAVRLGPDKVRDHRRNRGIEAGDVEHAAIVCIRECEAVGGHRDHHRLRVTDKLVAILSQGLRS